MIVLHATFPIDPEKRDEAVEAIEDLVEATRAEEGVLEYRVATDLEDPNLFRFVERYEDEAAFAAHAESDHLERFQVALPDLLAGEPEAMRFDVESADELDL